MSTGKRTLPDFAHKVNLIKFSSIKTSTGCVNKKKRRTTPEIQIDYIKSKRQISYSWPSGGRFRVFDDSLRVETDLYLVPDLITTDDINGQYEVIISVDPLDLTLKKVAEKYAEPSAEFHPLSSDGGKHNLLVSCAIMCSVIKWIDQVYKSGYHTCYSTMTLEEFSDLIFQRMWVTNGNLRCMYKKHAHPSVRMLPVYMMQKDSQAVVSSPYFEPWHIVRSVARKVFGMTDISISISKERCACGPFSYVENVMRFILGNGENYDLNKTLEMFEVLRMEILQKKNWPEIMICRKNTVQKYMPDITIEVDCYDDDVVAKLLDSFEITGPCGYNIYKAVDSSKWQTRENVYGPLPFLMMLTFGKKLKCEIIFNRSVKCNKLCEVGSMVSRYLLENSDREISDMIPTAFREFCRALVKLQDNLVGEGYSITAAMDADILIYTQNVSKGTIKIHAFPYDFAEHKNSLHLLPRNISRNEYMGKLLPAVMKSFECTTKASYQTLMFGVLLMEVTQHQFRSEYKDFDGDVIETLLRDVSSGSTQRLWIFEACRSESLCLLVAYMMHVSASNRPLIGEVCESIHMLRWVESGDMENLSEVIAREKIFSRHYNRHMDTTEGIMQTVEQIPDQTIIKRSINGGWRKIYNNFGWERNILKAFASSTISNSGNVFLSNARNINTIFYNDVDGYVVNETGAGSGVNQESVTMYCEAVNSLCPFTGGGDAKYEDWYTLGVVLAHAWMKKQEICITIPKHFMKWMLYGENAKLDLIDMYFFDKRQTLHMAELLMYDNNEIFTELMLDFSDVKNPSLLFRKGSVTTDNVLLYVNMKVQDALHEDFQRRNIRALHKGYQMSTLDVRPPSHEVLYQMFCSSSPSDLTFESVIYNMQVTHNVSYLDEDSQLAFCTHKNCLTKCDFHQSIRTLSADHEVVVYCVVCLLREYLRNSSQEQLSDFLRFVTSIPWVSNKRISIMVEETTTRGYLPKSLTCQSRIILYQEICTKYENREQAQHFFNKQMDTALSSVTSFGLL